jgi:transposase
MAWKPEHRHVLRQRHKARRGQRYPSDLADAEWERVKPLIPLPRRRGRPRTVDMRAVVNAILYVGWTGCQWEALPHQRF